MNNTSRKNDIDALIINIKSQYIEIERLYNISLHKKQIDSDLKIKVKNYLENARSILDYCAHDIAKYVGIVANKIYFPIVEKEKNKNSFEGSIGRNLPGLEPKNQKIYNYLESIQPYHQNFSWLADFVTVVSDTKHSQLTPQSRNEIQRIVSRHSSGSEASWDPNLVEFGAGTFINGAQVNPFTQMPMQTPETTLTKEIWVDFKFNNTISALPLLKNICDNIPKIIEIIYIIL